MSKITVSLDEKIILFSQKAYPIFTRISLFLIYFWFGILKVLGFSPAGPLVAELLQKTLPFLTAEQFIFWFGWLEILIGVLFLIPQFTRAVMLILALHLVTTAGPLILLPQITWQNFLVPTLEGQYIIKNLLIISAALGLMAPLKSWKNIIGKSSPPSFK